MARSRRPTPAVQPPRGLDTSSATSEHSRRPSRAGLLAVALGLLLSWLLGLLSGAGELSHILLLLGLLLLMVAGLKSRDEAMRSAHAEQEEE